MRPRTIALLFVACAPLMGPAGAPGGRSEAATSRQVVLRLRAPAAALQRGAAPVELVSQRRIPGALPRERRPELSTQQLVLVLLGAGNEELARVSILDPRIVRAEFPGPDGRLSSTLLVGEDVEFPVLVPDHPGARRLEIFEPEWTGAKFVLVPVGGVAVP